MAEPNTAASAAIAVGSGISLVAGTVLGLPLPALVFGLAGGLVALKTDAAARTLWARVTTVATSTIIAAAWAPNLAAIMQPDGAHPGLWMAGTALAVGTGAELLLSEVLQAAVHRIRQIGGRAGE